MAQRVATPQGTKRRHPGFSSPPGLHAEESESRRPPYPPPGSMGGLQAPQVGVAVVTIDMFRDYQRQVAAEFDRQNALFQDHIQSVEQRIRSLEDAEDKAIDAVRHIRDILAPRVDRHHETLETLTVTVSHHNGVIESWGNLTQEFRAQGRDPARPNQLAWRPGPLGSAGDQVKNTVEELKAQMTRSFASLAEHDRRLRETDAHLETHNKHLTDYERRVGEHDARLTTHDRQLGDFSTRLGVHDRHFGEYNGRLGVIMAKQNEGIGGLDKMAEQLNGRVTILEQRTDHGLSPAQITAIMQNHQQRLESLEKTLQHHIKVSQEALTAKPSSSHTQPHSPPGRGRTPGSGSYSPPDRSGKTPDETQSLESHNKKPPRQQEERNDTLDLRQLGEHLDAIDKRVTPLEQRINLVEKELEKLSQPGTTPESMSKDLNAEEEGQYEILMQTNFQRPEELSGLRSNEDSQFLMQLFSEKDKCDDACYTVQRACVHMWSYLPCHTREDERLASDFWNKPEWVNHPSIIELERNASMPKGKYFPRYVYEIGEIFNRRVVSKYSGQQATHRSTGYHLVVDVTKPEKSLWLVYRYHEVGSDGRSLKQSITYKRDGFWHPFASVCEFDIAMIFERFQDWKGTDTPMGSFATSKKLVRQTAASVRPTFVEPDFQELKDEIRRSWG
ncbi:hypothetical protein F4802DRAFT_562903 [Xylaria palmicola]|nr:hypothetical protein F4802DRAFT_562903 [Xylaria palmicola]